MTTEQYEPITHEYEAQCYVLGALFSDRTRASVVLKGVSPDWFVGDCAEACRVLLEAPDSIYKSFSPMHGLGSDITNYSRHTANWEFWVDELDRIRTAKQTAELADAIKYRAEKDVDYSDYLEKIKLVNERCRFNPMPEFSDIWQENFDENKRFIPTGFPLFDHLYPIHHGEYVVIAGRPSAGKTSWAVQVMMNMAKDGRNILYFSLDDYPQLTVKKLLCHYTGASQDQLLRHKEESTNACLQMQTLPIHVAPQQVISIEDIRAYAEMQKRQNPELSVIVVDHLTKIRVNSPSAYERTTRATTEIYALSKELDVTVFALCQLNREVEKQERPIKMSDLRDSGATEQDATKIIGFDALDRKDKSLEWEVAGSVLKNKTGMRGTIKYNFSGPHFRFTEHQIQGD